MLRRHSKILTVRWEQIHINWEGAQAKKQSRRKGLKLCRNTHLENLWICSSQVSHSSDLQGFHPLPAAGRDHFSCWGWYGKPVTLFLQRLLIMIPIITENTRDMAVSWEVHSLTASLTVLSLSYIPSYQLASFLKTMNHADNAQCYLWSETQRSLNWKQQCISFQLKKSKVAIDDKSYPRTGSSCSLGQDGADL